MNCAESNARYYDKLMRGIASYDNSCDMHYTAMAEDLST
jgi:hypothetical protein